MRSICAKVPMAEGDIYRKKLLKAQLIDKKLIIKRNGRFLYIPLQASALERSQNEIKKLKLKLEEHEFEQYPERINDYRLLMEVPDELIIKLPRSYDIIGTIAILKIPIELNNYYNQIGEAIIKTHKNIRTVARDSGVEGKLRIRKLEIIAGTPETETIHNEYGIRLKLDVYKVYFSPRLSREHYRIAKLVEPGELVLDMFTGIGPFSLMVSKHSKAKQIFSIDLNKTAIEYLVKNIDLNKSTNIFPLEGNITDMIKKIPKVDRIIMNLPMSAREYMPEAFAVLKPKGIIHYHEMLVIKELNKRKEWLKTTANRQGFEILEMTEHNLGSYSPIVYHFVFDLKLEALDTF